MSGEGVFPRLRLLPASLANQIAAGEVVERPLSVVKELVENSLDADADWIYVRIAGGGIQLVEVADDGVGIHPGDLQLALVRHSTSKIRDISDLQNIASFGFRGEALPSIAAVALVEIESKISSQEHAWRISSVPHGTDSPQLLPSNITKGTSVRVSDLFSLMPARRKFLRSPRTEVAGIVKLINKMSLANSQVGFSLKSERRQILNYPPAKSQDGFAQRMAKVFGEPFAQQSCSFTRVCEGLKVCGWLGQPIISRSQADQQYIFVNSRIVQDKGLAFAVRRGYSDVLFHGRHPSYVLYISLPCKDIDVNVHPAKTEIKFRFQQKVYDFVRVTVQQTLAGLRPGNSINLAKYQGKLANTPSTAVPSTAVRDIGEHSGAEGSTHQGASYTRSASLGDNSLPRQGGGDVAKSVQEQHPASYRDIGSGSQSSPLLRRSQPRLQQGALPQQNQLPPGPLGHALGLLHRIFIVAQNDHGMILVDTHAAHERILYEKLKREYSNNAVQVQPFLVPVRLQVSYEEWETCCKFVDQYALWGVGLQAVSEELVMLLHLPSVVCSTADPEKIVHDLLSESVAAEPEGLSFLFCRILSSRACHSAFRAHDNMTVDEMNAFLRKMESTDNIGQCNHGRPTWVELPLNQLDNLFKRGR